MALPLAMSQRPPSVISVPNEDGSHYVLVEAGTRTPTSSLPRMWKKKAKDTCKGDYLVLSEAAHEQKRQGMRNVASHEGWVRCLNPEATEDEVDEVKEDLEDSQEPAANAS
jgi:hypothetical protein